MRNQSVDDLFSRGTRSHLRSGDDLRGRSRVRMPSSAGYMIAAIVIAIGSGFLLWWMLANGGDEGAWLPAGLAVCVILLVALSAREVVMRRAWTKYLLDNGIQGKSTSRSSSHGRSQKKTFSASLHSAALRAIQKQSNAADSPGSPPELHLEVAKLCHDYLASTEEAMRSRSAGGEKGLAIRAGQERVRLLHKHHLLTWARGHSLSLTREAQQRARTFDKIETANKALECIDSALGIYPDEAELHQSRAAIEEFIASVKIAHWVELAERSAFKRHYRRAIDRYRDALFYLNQDVIKEDVRVAGTERIEKEIEKLQAALRAADSDRNATPNER